MEGWSRQRARLHRPCCSQALNCCAAPAAARRWLLPLAQLRAAAAARAAEGLQLVLHYGDLVDVVGEEAQGEQRWAMMG
jgi:hypothetical protein